MTPNKICFAMNFAVFITFSRKKGAGHEMCPAQCFLVLIHKLELISADLNRLQYRDVDWLIK